MRLRMKNLKCFWCSLKNWALRGGFHKKPIQRGRGGCLKMGELGQFANLKGGFGKKEGVVFEGGLIPQYTLCEGPQ